MYRNNKDAPLTFKFACLIEILDVGSTPTASYRSSYCWRVCALTCSNVPVMLLPHAFSGLSAQAWRLSTFNLNFGISPFPFSGFHRPLFCPVELILE